MYVVYIIWIQKHQQQCNQNLSPNLSIMFIVTKLKPVVVNVFHAPSCAKRKQFLTEAAQQYSNTLWKMCSKVLAVLDNSLRHISRLPSNHAVGIGSVSC